jgi:NDP-sugar pyrophosphorylase family protein
VKASDLFQLPPSLAHFAAHFPPDALPWEWLKGIGAALDAFTYPAKQATVPAGVHVTGRVFIDPTAILPPYAVIIGPAWIGPGTEIRPGAFVRGNVIVGAKCVLGNSCEYKNCLLLDGVATPHFNYVGDSILGNGAHLAAGVICSNLRLDQKPVVVRGPDRVFETGLRKLGALVGDRAEVGCNAVLNPGAILGPRSFVAPGLAFGGYLPPATVARSKPATIQTPRRD